MNPVAIVRHMSSEGAGYFATFLERHSVPWTLLKIDAGDALPTDPEAYSGLCFMGGPMSVNDHLPWIPPTLDLIRAAVAHGIPVIGHCLGGQLMAKALGGKVTRNPVKEIGWGTIESTDGAAGDWLGNVRQFVGFHWHGETFSIPPGATRILGSAFCSNQAYVLGPHLGMQCHVEMTEEMIREWNRAWATENATPSPSVQTPEQMLADVTTHVRNLHGIADRLYGRWIAGLDRR
jgi:GMP synthase-like glutamine amidotransferase